MARPSSGCSFATAWRDAAAGLRAAGAVQPSLATIIRDGKPVAVQWILALKRETVAGLSRLGSSVVVVAPGFSGRVDMGWGDELGQAVGGDVDDPVAVMDQPVVMAA